MPDPLYVLLVTQNPSVKFILWMNDAYVWRCMSSQLLHATEDARQGFDVLVQLFAACSNACKAMENSSSAFERCKQELVSIAVAWTSVLRENEKLDLVVALADYITSQPGATP